MRGLLAFIVVFSEELWLTLNVAIVLTMSGAFLAGLYLVLRNLLKSKKQSSR